MPYGHMPVRARCKACGPADAEGEIRERIQTNGRCESSNDRGDTYGPVSYLAYVPGYLAFGWTRKWDDLPAAHATSLLFDLLALVGLALVGRRFGGAWLASALAVRLGRVPVHSVRLEREHERRDHARDPDLGLLAGVGELGARRRGGARGWTKFGALLCAPLWLSYPDGWTWPRVRRYALGFGLATLAAFSILLLEPEPLHAARVFAERTFGFQLDRESPFSLWDWRQYHAAGIPDLKLVQQGSSSLLVASRSRSPSCRAARGRSSWPRSPPRSCSASSWC